MELFQQKRGNQGKQAHGEWGIRLGWKKDTTGIALHSMGRLKNRRVPR
jgi:hypothetical protein